MLLPRLTQFLIQGLNAIFMFGSIVHIETNTAYSCDQIIASDLNVKRNIFYVAIITTVLIKSH